jgi:hypothetical protein
MDAGYPSARGEVLRSALFFSPFLVVTLLALGLIVRELADDGMSGGTIVGTVLIGSVAVLLGYQVIQSIRDLFSRPVETTGLVERLWSRNEFLLFRNTYVFVSKNVFRVPTQHLLDVERGDLVRIVHYPHTGTVEHIEKVTAADG